MAANPTLGEALPRRARKRGRAAALGAVECDGVARPPRARGTPAGIIGRIVVGFVGVAWSLVTFLVVPILVVEQLSVGAAVKRSAELFKHTWGENVVTNGGVWLLGTLAAIAGLVVVLPLLLLGGVATALGIVIASPGSPSSASS